ncbi:phosphoglycerate mutase [Mycoplasma ovis str. Michigan]|uniref:phosphoglycerate mutase (2,3-diphosphoglycerate-independent) n=1 Tax=Mycoplasma ovis str. Michigan TaxID=1415773 RepID=A0ABN4BM63_9MOLU|nr:phosphoglycerate mutase [Mycoplasma ovis str. Michigan]
MNKSIETGDFPNREGVLDVFEQLKFNGNTNLHIYLLASRGGIDSYLDHLYAFLDVVKKHGIKPFVHIFSDGKDVPKKQFLKDLPEIEAKIKETGGILSSISGRFYAMDEGEMWDRIDKVWKAFLKRKGTPIFKSALEYVKSQYENTSDEWIVPAISEEYSAGPGLREKDIIVNLNYLKYGTRQLSHVLVGSADLYDHNPPEIPEDLGLFLMVDDSRMFDLGSFFEDDLA